MCPWADRGVSGCEWVWVYMSEYGGAWVGKASDAPSYSIYSPTSSHFCNEAGSSQIGCGQQGSVPLLSQGIEEPGSDSLAVSPIAAVTSKVPDGRTSSLWVPEWPCGSESAPANQGWMCNMKEKLTFVILTTKTSEFIFLHHDLTCPAQGSRLWEDGCLSGEHVQWHVNIGRYSVIHPNRL